MSRRKLLLAGSALAGVLIAALLALLDESRPDAITHKQADSVKLGMTVAEVESLLGRPRLDSDLPDSRIPKNGMGESKDWGGAGFDLYISFDNGGRVQSVVRFPARKRGLWERVRVNIRRLLP